MPTSPKYEEETQYYQIDDGGWRRPSSSGTSPSSVPISRTEALVRDQSLDLSSRSGSFSQSKDFQRIFEISKGNETAEYEEEEVYIVRQRYGTWSIIFSLGQILVLVVMVLNCGLAPLNINPMIGPYPDALSDWGGKNAVNILEDNEWWRLITPIMLHAGVIHLLCNIAVQLETGAFFEREWGSKNWLIIYLSSAVGSSILSVIVMPGAISVGSSGAVMG